MSQPAEDEPIELLLETSDDEEEAAGEQVIVDVEGRKRERSVETRRANAQNKRNGLSIAQKAALLDEYDRRASKRQKWSYASQGQWLESTYKLSFHVSKPVICKIHKSKDKIRAHAGTTIGTLTTAKM